MANRKEHPNRSTNSGYMVEKSKHDDVSLWHLANYREENGKCSRYRLLGYQIHRNGCNDSVGYENFNLWLKSVSTK